MIEISAESFQQSIIDQEMVMGRAERASLRVFTKFGAFVRQRAKTLLRQRKSISDPGAPPSSHLGLIRDHILFVVEPATKNVIIGPLMLHRGSPTALEALEHGGESLIMRHGKPISITIQPRPFMQPAFDTELEQAPELWRDSL
jgi:hypothetical protein